MSSPLIGMPGRCLAAVVLALVLGTLVAGCGSSGSSSSDTSGQTGAGTGATTAPAGTSQIGGAPSLVVPPPLTVGPWDPDSDNDAEVKGQLTLGGTPVEGVRLRVGQFELAPTGADGAFTYLVDTTVPARYPISVADASAATVGGSALSESDRTALSSAAGAITVAYALADLQTSVSTDGSVLVSGRLSLGDGTPVPTVRIYSYQLTGRVTDAEGRPIVGANVSTRTNDRDYWTVSKPTDENGNYVSLFTASDEAGNDPVPFAIRVAKGSDVFEFLPDEYVYFRRLQSAELDIRLPPTGFAMALPVPRSYPGAVYQGVIVGATADGQPVKPLAAGWPDAQGRFSLTLPSSLRGKTVSLWEAQTQLFSSSRAEPGSDIDLDSWPAKLDAGWPQDVAQLTLPG